MKRKPTKEEHQYINRVYKGKRVFHIYLLIVCCISLIGILSGLCIVSQFYVDLAAQRIQAMIPECIMFCFFLTFITIYAIIILHRKNAVKLGKYLVAEGMAEHYIPYEIPEVKKYLTSNGMKYSGANSPIQDGQIYFRSDTPEVPSDWVSLKYRSCPKGTDLGEFPVLLIQLPDDTAFAITDWNKIQHDPNYQHIKPFMVLDKKKRF